MIRLVRRLRMSSVAVINDIGMRSLSHVGGYTDELSSIDMRMLS